MSLLAALRHVRHVGVGVVGSEGLDVGEQVGVVRVGGESVDHRRHRGVQGVELLGAGGDEPRPRVAQFRASAGLVVGRLDRGLTAWSAASRTQPRCWSVRASKVCLAEAQHEHLRPQHDVAGDVAGRCSSRCWSTGRCRTRRRAGCRRGPRRPSRSRCSRARAQRGHRRRPGPASCTCGTARPPVRGGRAAGPARRTGGATARPPGPARRPLCRPVRQDRVGDRASHQRLLGVVAGDRHRRLDRFEAGDAGVGEGPDRRPAAVDLTGGDRLRPDP